MSTSPSPTGVVLRPAAPGDRRTFSRCVALALTAAIAATAACGGGHNGEPEDSAKTGPPGRPPAASSALPKATPAAPPLLCPGSDPLSDTTLDVRQPPDLDEPAPRVPFRDPVFGSCLVRVTDRTSDLSADDKSAGLKNEYSRLEAFNADSTLVLARGIEATYYLYDVNTLRPLGELRIGEEPRWDPLDPSLLYYLDGLRLTSLDVRSGETRLVHDFASEFPEETPAAVWTRWEGRPSADGRYWGFMAEDQNWQPVAFLVYDKETDHVMAKRDLRGVPAVEDDIDHVTMSPLGTYFVASFDRYCGQGELGDDDDPCGFMVYDRDLQNGRGLMRIFGHYDLALDAGGREVAVFQDIDNDTIAMLDLATGAVTPLWPIDFSHTAIGLHISGCAVERPGWALVSTHDGDTASHTWMDDQVFAMELKPQGRVVRLAHTHSLVDESQEHDYWAEPHASVNADFTRAVFTSNWGRSGTEEVEMYIIEVPDSWLGPP